MSNSPLVFKIQSEKTSIFDDFSLCFQISQLRNLKTQGKVDVFSASFGLNFKVSAFYSYMNMACEFEFHNNSMSKLDIKLIHDAHNDFF